MHQCSTVGVSGYVSYTQLGILEWHWNRAGKVSHVSCIDDQFPGLFCDPYVILANQEPSFEYFKKDLQVTKCPQNQSPSSPIPNCPAVDNEYMYINICPAMHFGQGNM